MDSIPECLDDTATSGWNIYQVDAIFLKMYQINLLLLVQWRTYHLLININNIIYKEGHFLNDKFSYW